MYRSSAAERDPREGGFGEATALEPKPVYQKKISGLLESRAHIAGILCTH